MSIPSHFGRYRVLRPLATGEMGIVYLAEDPLIGRKVAIKGIRFDPCADDDEIQRLQRRFDQEIQIAGTFSHPNIVTLFDVGRQSGRSFIAMEYVDGRNLRADLQASGPLMAEQALRIAVPLCRALAYAHERGVVHRDIKPTNILVASDGTPKITDFGVARLFGSTLTHAGKIFGTPAYMSPEQAVGGKLTGASDQFALAAVIYELLTGERPFKGESPTAVIYEVLEHQPPPPHEVAPLVPTAISAVIMRGLAKDPQDRFDDCNEMADALKDALAWSKANPELAYFDDGMEQPQQVAEAAPADWRTAVSRLRGHADAAWAALAASPLWQKGRDAAVRMAEQPRSLAALAGGTLGLAALLSAVTWAASTAGPVRQLDPGGTPDSGVLAAAASAAGAQPERDRVVSHGSQSHDLDAPGAPAAIDSPPSAPGTDGAGAADGWDGTAPADATASELLTRSFIVSSRPDGARVTLNGEPLAQASPVAVELHTGERYALRLERDGFRPLSWTFSLDELDASHLESGQLHFPLQAVAARTEQEIAATAGAAPIDLPVSDSNGATVAGAAGDSDATSGPPPSPASIRRLRAPAEAPAPAKLHHVDPTLPAGADVDGVVVLEIEVSTRGNVVQAKVLRGIDAAANQAALDAVVRWKYAPIETSDPPVHVILTVSLPIQRSN